MHNILVRSLSKRILLETQSDNAKEYFQSSIVPNIFVQDFKIEIIEDKNINADLVIKHIHSEEREIFIDFSKKKYLFLDNWEEKTPTYVLSFLQFAFTSLLLQDSIYTLHASSVQGKNFNFIFTGRAGSGKTSTMLELVSKYNYSFISNNKVSILIDSDKVNVTGGAKGITIRDNDTFEKYKNIASPNFQKVYSGRTAFVFNNDRLADLTQQRKLCIFSLKINTGVEEFYKMTDEDSIIHLYPIFIESVDREVLLFNWSEPVPLPYDEYLIKKTALGDLRAILPQIDVYHLSGSMEFILNKVNELDNN